jgi:Chaperone of endosialidase
MTLRPAGHLCFLLAITALLTSRAVQAQCDNSTLGAFNTCFGTDSLAADSNGTGNAAFGLDALQFDTTGAMNTAAGIYALNLNVSGWANTAVGAGSLATNVSGYGNTGVGHWALEATTASYNTAIGNFALQGDTTGSYNLAGGVDALYANTTGTFNVALGGYAGYATTTGGFNTSVGGSALQNLTTGNSNLALGVNAGINYTGAESNDVVLAHNGVAGESGVTRIGTNGTQTKAFIAGIYGVTSASGTWVVVNSAGQLGTVTSSRRFKEDIEEMGSAGDTLLKLRPVTFRYKAPYDDGQRVLQYGLIAEEVAAVDPGLVQYGEDGKPLTVRYHFVNAMLLGEVQKQHATLTEQAARIAAQESRIAAQKAQIDELGLRLAKIEARAASRP